MRMDYLLCNLFQTPTHPCRILTLFPCFLRLNKYTLFYSFIFLPQVYVIVFYCFYHKFVNNDTPIIKHLKVLLKDLSIAG